jgi:hypothetical protein
MDAQRQHIVVTIATRIEGTPTMGERYARSQSVVRSPEELSIADAKRRVKTVLKAKLVENAAKPALLQTWPESQQPGRRSRLLAGRTPDD